MTLPQIKSTTGHKSDSVVQGYIDNSIAQKRTSADAISVSRKRKIVDTDVTDENLLQNVYNITGNNCVVTFNNSSGNKIL